MRAPTPSPSTMPTLCTDRSNTCSNSAVPVNLCLQGALLEYIFAIYSESCMKRIVIGTAIGAAIAMFQPAAYAVDAKLAHEELKEHGCLVCHEMDKKKVGPAYKEVAARFKDKPVEELMASMKSKPVHKAPLQKTGDSSLKMMCEYIQAQ